MVRIACLIALVSVVSTSLADAPPSLADLVRQLSDSKFAVREAAQQAILKRGEGIIPELDKFSKPTDPETLERLKKIRHALETYKDEIRELLPMMQSYGALGESLRHLIIDPQPGSLNLLLAIANTPRHPLRSCAVQAFIASRQVATVDQVDTFIQQSLVLRSTCRPKLPALSGVPIPIEVRLCEDLNTWLPLEDNFGHRSRTTCYVDGKSLGRAYPHPYAYASISRHDVREIAVGKHTFHGVLDYEFTHRGQKRTGKIVSEQRPIEIMPLDSVDDLAAPKSVDTTNLVRAALIVEGVPIERDQQAPALVVQTTKFVAVEPQVTVVLDTKKLITVVCPQWRLQAFLPVDLCFNVEFRDVQSGNVYDAGTICALRSSTTGSYLFPKNPESFFRGREGLVAVEIVLKPSRLLALETPSVKRYCSDEISVGVRYLKIVPLK